MPNIPHVELMFRTDASEGVSDLLAEIEECCCTCPTCEEDPRAESGVICTCSCECDDAAREIVERLAGAAHFEPVGVGGTDARAELERAGFLNAEVVSIIRESDLLLLLERSARLEQLETNTETMRRIVA